MATVGLEHVMCGLGTRVVSVKRFVLGLGLSNDEFGHGITQIDFENCSIVVRPGPNEDYLVIELGPVDSRALDPEYWTQVDLSSYVLGMAREGHLSRLDVFSDGVEDVALVFGFDNGGQFSILLLETDVILRENVDAFKESGVLVSLRRSVEAG
jgi:hypothetical protein